MDDAAVHPRPQLTRPRWTDLSGTWQFAYDDDDRGLRERWFERALDDRGVFDRTIRVPFPPESAASGIDDHGFHRVLWYRTTFEQRPDPDGALLLHFGAVDHSAQVWVNGRLVGSHEGGHTPFTLDVTQVLTRDDGPQVLVVRAEDDPRDLEQPRGKQDWEELPHAIWYERTSGIWQPVWLEPVPLTRIERLRWTPDLDAALLRLDIRLACQDDRPLRLHVVLTLQGEVLADETVAVRGRRALRDFAFTETDTTLGRNTLLWKPDNPNLIDATIRVLDGDGVIDEVESYTAMRSIAAAGRRVLLNGRPYFLRLVLDQGYWRESHLAAPSGEALRREVEVVRELGFNGVRLHQKVTDPRFLYWCDRLGLLVWAEMPAAYEFSPVMMERVVSEWLEVVERDYSHPCVVAWVPVNESWGVPRLERSAAQRDFVRALYHLTKAYDPTRMVIGNDGWEQIVSDVITVHDYTGRGGVLRERYGTAEAVEHTLQRTQPSYRSLLLDGVRWDGQPVVVSEFGGVSYVMDEEESWDGYGAVRSAKDLLDRYRQLVDALIDSPAIAGFCWTQLTDTLQEKNGLLTERRVPKIEPSVIRRITRRPAAAVPGDQVGSFEYGDYPPEVMDPR